MAALGSYYGAPTRAFVLLPHASDAGAAAFLPLGPTVKSLWHQNKGGGGALQKQKAEDAHNDEKIVCMGKDWYRFPSSYWLPDNHRLAFISTLHFDGHLPGDFEPVHRSGSLRASTSARRDDFNAMNRWEPLHALRSDEIDRLCDYVVDIEYPARSEDREEEAIVADGSKWNVVGCERILDADNTWLLGRVLYVPWQLGRQRWGSMCVYKKK
ncbi:mannosyltransferase [Coemansia sp. RSA 2559]|nr:mannosyltransferase [Coemansia sp. RSA 2559]